jgi:hypothetical protein
MLVLKTLRVTRALEIIPNKHAEEGGTCEQWITQSLIASTTHVTAKQDA